MKNPFNKNSKPYLFFELAKPNEEGYSRKVFATEFTGKYSKLQTGNGGDWCRTDGSLGKRFNIERFKEKNKIIAVQLFGKNTKAQIRKYIKREIHNQLSKERCVFLDIGSVEVDHKDGHRDNFDNLKYENQKVDDFQPLSKAANNAKKEHCKSCRKNKKRFDARKLGYKVSVWAGDLEYRNTCVGCYWYDPKKFNQEISKNFKNITDL